MKFLIALLFIVTISTQVKSATWFVRNGGSTTTNCTGLADADYDGSGTGEACAYSNLQNALNNSAGGDIIILKAGQTFVGSFSLPNKAGSSYITVKSSLADSLPLNNRVFPTDVAKMATIRTNVPNGEAIFTQSAAHHFRFHGLEITLTSGVSAEAGMRFGSNPKETSLSQITHDFEIDRCYIHGLPTGDSHQGIVANAEHMTIKNNYISDWHWVGVEAQAILIFTSPGDITIFNNTIIAAGENILVGGADPGITNLVPTGIIIKQNHIFKPLSWKVSDPSYAGFHWTVKNSLELKNAKNVTIEANIIENCWLDAQVGIPVLFTIRNQENTAPWSAVENVTFKNNWVKNTAGGINFLGWDNEGAPGQRGTTALISNNLFTTIGPEPWVEINGFYNVTIDHNTHFQTNSNLLFYNENSTGFVWKNDMTIYHDYGIVGFDSGGNSIFGTPVFAVNAPGSIYSNNVIVGAAQSGFTYSTANNNSYPIDTATVKFVDFANGNYQLQSSSPYHNAATDGTDIGYNKSVLDAALLHTIDGLGGGVGSVTQCNWNTNPACN